MMKKNIILNLILTCIVILNCSLNITVNAVENSSGILIKSSKNNVSSNEKFTISINANNTNIAAYTLCYLMKNHLKR